ncbi:LOW QUALITY PROTEIN: cytochrome P450 2C31-like [Physeter macrocephalus]|uniref:LOW QUALITY PROTEIN: cytochrome P450 2C31-like n=1 Tax=Physeter macrocephalus TaxID=9755 RepID=A0A2Y9FCZ0_PHYMC|nr:LOW QUALITY PROTEIN: cytochrome P450 2C31-like [Physeter catodon]|eukprot:XP_007119987.2 LOW QUALITY PROTEIN: cytochrome P450 2C31-like [Physeter catodon]
MGPAELSLQPWDPVSPQLAQAHGNVFTVWVGPTPVVVLSGFRVVKEALVSNSEQLSGRPLTPLFRDLFGERGRPFDPRVHIVTSTARVIGALVFGRCFLLEEPFFQELIQAIDFGLAFVSTIWRRLYDLFPWAFRHRPGPHQEMFRYQKAVRGYICREISRHKLRTPEAPKDFISCYLAQITKATDDPVSTFNEENLIQVVVDLFLGGTDTTATTLCWALIYMVQHGAIQERVQRELDEVLGTSRAVRYEDRKRLPYTRAVLHEVQRLSSVVTAGAVRQCVTSTRVHSHPMPKSTIILPNLASVLYDPECWETPQQFNPGHFWDKDGNFLVNEAFLPFSAGHRVCLGDQLVQMELFLMFATLLRTFWFQLPERSPGLRLEYIFGGTRQPWPQKICAVPRLNCLKPRSWRGGRVANGRGRGRSGDLSPTETFLSLFRLLKS